MTRNRIAAALAAGVLIAAGAGAASAATAHPSKCTAWTCPAVMTNLGPWAPALWPSSLYMGNGHAPYLTGLKWPKYLHAGATAKGILHTWKTSCLKTGSRTCKQYKLAVTASLSHTLFHCGPKWQGKCTGGYFYSLMNWAYKGTGFAAPREWDVVKGWWK
jgi:hypothetical protein